MGRIIAAMLVAEIEGNRLNAFHSSHGRGMPNNSKVKSRYMSCIFRDFQIAVLTVVLAGCVISGPVEKSPSFEEFGDSQLNFRVQGAPNEILAQVQDFLTRKKMPSTVTVRAPNTYVITSYIEEPHKIFEKRVRKTSFRIGISGADPGNSSRCTTVLVSTLTKSRGIHEELWSIQEADAQFESSALPQIQDAFLKKTC